MLVEEHGAHLAGAFKPTFRPGLESPRVLGDVDGGPGRTLVVLTAMHGNEEGGVLAAQRLLHQLHAGDTRPRGRIVVLACNLGALRKRVRYLDVDLNRMWQPGAPERAQAGSLAEFAEYEALNACLARLIASAQGPLTVVDLHSFSGKGIPFLIAPENDCPRVLLGQVPFPVVWGLSAFVHGTLCGHLERLGHRTVAFEGGRDADPDVPVNMEAFLWQVLARMGLMDEALIPAYARRTWHALFHTVRPPVRACRAVYRHRITERDRFVMRPGFATFDRVSAGQPLADDARGVVTAPADGLLLMPLYQGQGEDGFFLAVEEPGPPP